MTTLNFVLHIGKRLLTKVSFVLGVLDTILHYSSKTFFWRHITLIQEETQVTA